MNVPITFDERVNQWEGLEIDASGCWLRKDVKPGASWWVRTLLGGGIATPPEGEVAVLRFSCPCGCGYVVSVPVKPGYSNQVWNWNGSLEKPTLTPSIQKLSGCRWHGHLTDGVFIPC